MSIENRLAAKKRSAKARKKAKVKAAFDLALIILIPVVVLVIVFIVINNIKSQEIDYSKHLTADGYVEGYDLSKEVTLPELTYEAMNIKYEDFAPESQGIEDQIAIELKAKIPENERPTGEDEAAIKAAYIALVTDENVEKYFAEELGDKYPHTAEGYRTYVKDTLGLITDDNVYESYGGKKAFKKAMEESATEVVKQDLALLAVFDKLGLSCTKEDLDQYITDSYVTADTTIEDIKERYGENYMMLECKTYKAVQALKALIPVPEFEHNHD